MKNDKSLYSNIVKPLNKKGGITNVENIIV